MGFPIASIVGRKGKPTEACSYTFQRAFPGEKNTGAPFVREEEGFNNVETRVRSSFGRE